MKYPLEVFYEDFSSSFMLNKYTLKIIDNCDHEYI